MVLRAAKLRMTMGALFIVCAVGVCAQNENGAVQRLAVVGSPQLVRCAPITQIPCLSVTVTPSDASGRPVAARLPTKDRLLQAVQIQSGGAEVTPFYVSAASGSDETERPNIVLIELDISGSMNSPVSPGVSRFDAAKSAIARYLGTMQEGVDQIAIVPFESHHVVSTIRAAVFTSKRSEAMAQLNAVPQPDPKNDTALFQAVFSGVETMRAEMASLVKPGMTDADFQPRMIVMTDGKNDLGPGDDSNLLDGPLGMQQAAAQVAAANFDVIGIGFGDRDDIDVDALQRLSKQMFLATTGDELLNIFRTTTPLHTSDIQITFLAPWPDRPSLSSRDPQLDVALTLPDGRQLRSPVVRYATPAIGAPLYERQATPEEMRALLDARPAASSGWAELLRGLLIFAACSVALLLLWFWIPRLIWNYEYAGNPAFTGINRKWSKDAGVKASAVQMRTVANLPDGFDADEVRSRQQRSAEQITQVGAREAFSSAEVLRDV